MRRGIHEIGAPDVIPMRGPQPDTTPVVQPRRLNPFSSATTIRPYVYFAETWPYRHPVEVACAVVAGRQVLDDGVTGSYSTLTGNGLIADLKRRRGLEGKLIDRWGASRGFRPLL